MDISECRVAMRLLRRDVSSDELRRLFDQLDGDGSGELDFMEFLQLMHMLRAKDGVFEEQPIPVSTVEALEDKDLQALLELWKLDKSFVEGMSRDTMVTTVCNILDVYASQKLDEIEVKSLQELKARMQELKAKDDQKR